MKIEEIKTEKCLEILKRSQIGRLACSFDDQPYVVPFNFIYDGGEYLYAFSTVGQKINWMRVNPLVCVEVEEIKSKHDWTTLVIFGCYEELPDEPEFKDKRNHAYELLSRRPMWWQPAFVAGEVREDVEKYPVYYRIHISRITGHRGFSQELESFLPMGKPAKINKDSKRGMW